MTLAMPALFVAALLVGLWLRSRRLRRTNMLDIERRSVRAALVDLRAKLSYAEWARGIEATRRYRSERAAAHDRAVAAKEIGEWKGIAEHWLERMVTHAERAELAAAVESVEDELRKAAAQK